MSPIPAFSSTGVLPPFIGADPASSSASSPYETTVVELVATLATSLSRCDIVEGFLSHREELEKLGLVSGWQWINGSFCQHQDPPGEPGDIDVLTIAEGPSDPVAQAKLAADLTALKLQGPESKLQFRTDSYFVWLPESPEIFAAQLVYWYGLFSHARVSAEWKGMLSVPLGRTDDVQAAADLTQRRIDLNATP